MMFSDGRNITGHEKNSSNKKQEKKNSVFNSGIIFSQFGWQRYSPSTVNDYLARRDAGWMGPIFNLLGVTVSSIISEQSFIFDPDFVNKDAQIQDLLI